MGQLLRPKKKLDTRPHPPHDQQVDESPSLLETIIGFPGAVLRLPSSALATLEAINEVTERMDRLMTLLDQLDRGVNKAGSGIDFAALGISARSRGLSRLSACWTRRSRRSLNPLPRCAA